MLAFCRAEYGAVHLWRGRWAEAEALLEAAVEDFARRARHGSARRSSALAELRRRQGRPHEAPGCSTGRAVGGGAALPRAARARPRRRRSRAVELAERLLRQHPGRPRARPRACARAARPRAHRRGELDEATPRSRRCARSRGASAPPPLRASVDMAEGRARRGARRHERARTLLEDAVDGFERSGAPFEAAQARIELATLPRRARPRRCGRARGGARRTRPRRARSRAPRPRGPSDCSTRPPADRARRLGHAARARGAAPARRGPHEPPDRRAARRQRAHRSPARHEHPAQARPAVARRGRGVRGARRAREPPCRAGDREDGRSWRSRPATDTRRASAASDSPDERGSRCARPCSDADPKAHGAGDVGARRLPPLRDRAGLGGRPGARRGVRHPPGPARPRRRRGTGNVAIRAARGRRATSSPRT